MPTPSRTLVLDDAVVSTIDTYVERTPVDVVYNRSLVFGLLWRTAKEPGVAGPLLRALGVSSPRVSSQGGRLAVLPVAYQTPTSVTTFRGTQKVPTPIDPIMTEQYSPWAYYTAFAAIPFQESVENMGAEAIIDIAQARLDMTYRGFTDRLETDFWSDNGDVTPGSQEEIPGIQTYVSTTPTTGTVWNIAQATYTWQRSNQLTCNSFASNGLDRMRTMFVTCSGVNGIDPPSILITTPTVWGYYVKQAEGVHRVVDTKDVIDMSFPTARYMGRPVVHTSKCSSGKMYLLNFNYFRLLMHKGAEWKIIKPGMPNDQVIADQWRIVWSGLWGIERMDRQGVIDTITA